MIKVYTTNPPCPKCKVLKAKLDKANISYEVVDNVNEIISKGYGDKFMPIMETDTETMEFADAVNWVNGIKEN